MSAGGGRPSTLGSVGAKLAGEDLTCRFGDTLALSEVSLEVGAGEFVSIVGPSGCGKSTLFNVVSGLVPPTPGRVLIDGRDVTGAAGPGGDMLQKDLLGPWRTVVGNVVLGAALTRGVTRRDVQEARALAARYGLEGFLDHYPPDLSGGMRQRGAPPPPLARREDVL